jgi:tRNA U34 5-methylaminomethyl-2-thiouridine-forming methyltransferase MnmC
VQLQNKNENTRNLKKVQYKFKDSNFQTTTIICIVPKKKPEKRKKRQGFKCSLEINYLSMEMDRFSYSGLVSHLIVNKSCENMLLQADFGLTLGKKSFQAN